MSVNEVFYRRLIDSETEMEELEEKLDEGLTLIEVEKASGKPYDPNTDGRKILEPLYERRLYLQYNGAKTFHPYSEFGRLCLQKAQSIIDDYESQIGILNTRITSNNVDRFIGALTEDLIDDICTGRYQAIGALRYDGDGVCGVGALVYKVDTDLLGEEYILRIKWLFVKEPFRRRGVATSLLGGILWKNRALENENVMVEVPIDKEWYGAYYNMLSDWHFDMEEGYSPQLYLRVSDIQIHDDFAKMAANATPLKKLEKSQRKKAFDMMSEKDDRLIPLLNRKLPSDYFDDELSCFCVKNNELTGMLLVHRLPSQTVRVEYMGEDPTANWALLSHMLVMAKKRCAPDAVLEFGVETEEVGDYFDEYFDDHLRIPMAIADLQKPRTGQDISPEDAAWFLLGVL